MLYRREYNYIGLSFHVASQMRYASRYSQRGTCDAVRRRELQPIEGACEVTALLKHTDKVAIKPVVYKEAA